MSRASTIIIAAALSLVLCITAYIAVSGKDLFHIATGSVSHAMCDAVFVSHLDPMKVYAEEDLPANGMRWINWALHFEIDHSRREVRTTLAGAFGSRAIYRDGMGCLLVQGETPQSTGLDPPAFAGAFADIDVVQASNPALGAALDQAFAEPDPTHLRRTKAVVVLYDGKLIAERYAPGYGIETPFWAHSLSKSLTNALIGILVQQGKLQVRQPAPIAAWAAPSDPHHGIIIDQLLRMDSGLPFDETNGPMNPATRMWFLERDMAGFAETVPLTNAPGTAWGYSNLSFLILSQVVRDAAGGGAMDAQRFARRELFEPLGMRSAIIESDSTGTLSGAGHSFASARDWARFGQLYLDDGMAGARRILPQGWAAYSAMPTLDTGYGAGFWTNVVNEGAVPVWNAPWGMPELPNDMFYARGALGQLIVIVPSERLVVTRFGYTHDTGSGMGSVIAAIISALHAEPKL